MVRRMEANEIIRVITWRTFLGIGDHQTYSPTLTGRGVSSFIDKILFHRIQEITLCFFRDGLVWVFALNRFRSSFWTNVDGDAYLQARYSTDMGVIPRQRNLVYATKVAAQTNEAPKCNEQ